MAMEMASEATLQQIVKRASAGNTTEVAHRVLELQTADKFRLAGMLLDAGKPDLAEAVGTRACQEIQLSLLFAKKAGR